MIKKLFILLIVLMPLAASAQKYTGFSGDSESSGFSAIIRGGGFYNTESEQAGFTGAFIPGFKFSEQFFLGVGGGIDAYKGNPYFPVFATARIGLTQSQVQPVLFAEGGYAFPKEKFDYIKTTTPFFGAGLGVKFNTPSVALLLDLGWKLQVVNAEVSLPGMATVTEKNSANLLTFTVGLQF
ncbi:MAG TPA: hypothetical protein VEX63_01505 [Flavisolibacter sp.]|nr:hypothetical protein [Flavisolibacter sp.]